MAKRLATIDDGFSPSPSVTNASLSEIADRAKSELRESLRQECFDPMRAAVSCNNAPQIPFGKATANVVAGVKKLPGGVSRVTLPGWRQYCLQNLSEFATRSGGPIAMVSVPMTCP